MHATAYKQLSDEIKLMRPIFRHISWIKNVSSLLTMIRPIASASEPENI